MTKVKTETHDPHGGGASAEAVYEQRNQPLFGWGMGEATSHQHFLRATRLVDSLVSGKSEPTKKVAIFREVIETLKFFPTLSSLGAKELSVIGKPLIEKGIPWRFSEEVRQIHRESIHMRLVELLSGTSRGDALAPDFSIRTYGEMKEEISKQRPYVRELLFLDESGRIINLRLVGVNRDFMDLFPDEVEVTVVDDEMLVGLISKRSRLIEHMMYTLYTAARNAMNRAYQRARDAERSVHVLEAIIGTMRAVELPPVPPSVSRDLAMAS